MFLLDGDLSNLKGTFVIYYAMPTDEPDQFSFDFFVYEIDLSGKTQELEGTVKKEITDTIDLAFDIDPAVFTGQSPLEHAINQDVDTLFAGIYYDKDAAQKKVVHLSEFYQFVKNGQSTGASPFKTIDKDKIYDHVLKTFVESMEEAYASGQKDKYWEIFGKMTLFFRHNRYIHAVFGIADSCTLTTLPPEKRHEIARSYLTILTSPVTEDYEGVQQSINKITSIRQALVQT